MRLHANTKKGVHLMLDVSHVTKRYGKNLALDDVSFHLAPGDVTILLGPNGAGKSTIMKSIIGLAAMKTSHMPSSQLSPSK